MQSLQTSSLSSNDMLTWDRMIDVCQNFDEKECYKSHKQFYIAHTFSWKFYKKSVIDLFYFNRNEKRSIDVESFGKFAKVALELYNSNQHMVEKHNITNIEIVCRFNYDGTIGYTEAKYKDKMLCYFQMLKDYAVLRVYTDKFVFCDHSMHYEIPSSASCGRGPFIYGLDEHKIIKAV